ncbi:cytochrome-c peroxidase [Pseudooceanicola onchidii]|uniref:cytochrome-c peroxidase n=1 Tax=Pseudooceanicola onchidii TaxID=2562279 RepID=UPI0010AAC162|nr:cytochrome c peroxidase [Pseudooceanicola onchidii]
MRIWVTVGILSLQATLSLADVLPSAVTPADFPATDPLLVEIGRDLFFDPILSGNRNIACATCHHPTLASADGVSLGLGEGAVALGARRHVQDGNAPHNRIPRNAPALFNLGAHEFTVLFHDGRVQVDPDGALGFRMPANAELERPVPSVLAAQALMPVTSADEMAGQEGENPVSRAAREGRFAGAGGVWDLLCKRIEALPGYTERFKAVIGERKLHFTDIARAIAEFETFEFQSVDSPFDRHLRGEATLDAAQSAGMDLFYGKARCSTCHAGAFQTDHRFHAIGLPQFGPGKDAGGYADRGRLAVTGNEDDRYRFRTPSLRNVAVTAPYGHNGAYADLEAMVRHHLDPITSLTRYDRSQAQLPQAQVETDDWAAMDDMEEVIRIAEATEIAPIALSDEEVAQILAFLGALTDPRARTGRLGPPASVPSGLPLDTAN